MNREAYLQALREHLAPWFLTRAAKQLPPTHISIGFPSRRALATRNKRIGECWRSTCSEDGVSHILISPMLGIDDVGHVLAHELVHAVTPGAKHRGEFVTVARAIGLIGKPTATTAGPELGAELARIVGTLGEHPFRRLNADEVNREKQSTRMVLLECACGIKVRASRTAIAELAGGLQHSIDGEACTFEQKGATK